MISVERLVEALRPLKESGMTTEQFERLLRTADWINRQYDLEKIAGVRNQTKQEAEAASRYAVSVFWTMNSEEKKSE